MYKIIMCILLTFLSVFTLPVVVFGQTEVYGVLLSTDGDPMPATVISIRMENQSDIFGGYNDVQVGEDGSYTLTLREPGLYYISFRGVYHQAVTVPLLVTDQPAIGMDMVLLPVYFNDGRYFDNDEYLSWIRVVGDFNKYDFKTGIPFSRNDDGSISAFIPARADTVRYQVRGLGYGRGGTTPLPLADEYNVRPNSTFESVVYNDLPEDSLEVRFIPRQTIPYKRYLPDGAESVPYSVNGFIRFHRELDMYWIQPLTVHQGAFRSFQIVDYDITSGIPSEDQKQYQASNMNSFRLSPLMEEKQWVMAALDTPGLHPQQEALLLMAYVAVLHRIEMWQQQRDHMRERMPGARTDDEAEEVFDFDTDIEIDTGLLLKIPERVSPVHPAWNRAYTAQRFIMEKTEYDERVIDYLHNMIEHHPDERVVITSMNELIRYQVVHFSAVEEMRVYQLVLERFGEGEIARRAHEAFLNYSREAGR